MVYGDVPQVRAFLIFEFFTAQMRPRFATKTFKIRNRRSTIIVRIRTIFKYTRTILYYTSEEMVEIDTAVILTPIITEYALLYGSQRSINASSSDTRSSAKI